MVYVVGRGVFDGTIQYPLGLETINAGKCLFEEYEGEDVFGKVGLKYEELEMMEPIARKRLLEKAGLNPDEFDF